MRAASALLAACLPLLLAACPDDSMIRQPKLKTYEQSSIWPDGTSARPLPPGVVARDALARADELQKPPPVTEALLERGQDRFGIYCAPCHGLAGDGNGIIVARGFPPPPSYQIDRLKAAPAGHFVDVITNGYGVMYPYAARVAPRDRWAIAAYIRALQLSRDVPLASAPEAAAELP